MGNVISSLDKDLPALRCAASCQPDHLWQLEVAQLPRAVESRRSTRHARFFARILGTYSGTDFHTIAKLPVYTVERLPFEITALLLQLAACSDHP